MDYCTPTLSKSRPARGKRGWILLLALALLISTGAASSEPQAQTPADVAVADDGKLHEELDRLLTRLESNQPTAEQLAHLRLASDALARAELLGDDSMVARAELAIARHLNARALWEQEEVHALAALEAANRIDDKHSQLRARLMLAGLWVRREDLAPAQALLMEVLAAAEAQNDRWAQTRALLTLSSAAGRSGDLPAARELIDRGLVIAEMEGYNELLVRLLINSMHVAQLQGDKPRQETELARALAVEIDPPNRELSQTLMLVQLSMREDDPEASLRQAELLVAEAKASGNAHMQGFALEAQAKAQCDLQPTEAAVEQYERAAKLYEDLNLPMERATALSKAAECLTGLGEYQRAYQLSVAAQASDKEAVERRRTEAAASLNVAYQSEQRQRQLAQAEASTERLRAEVAAQQRDRLFWILLALFAFGVAGWLWVRIRSRDAQLRVVEAAQRARFDLLALTSHEIRNPAHGLVSALGALRARASDPASARLLNSAAHAADLISRLSTDTLDLSLIEQGRLSIERSPVDLLELLEEIIQLEQPAALDKGLTLRSEWSLPRGTEAMVDRQRLSQVLLNLFGNAIRYSKDGEILIRSWIDEEPQPRWRVEVVDCGPGLAPDELSRVFDAYFRGSASSRGVGGGLGLTVTRRIIEAHGGHIEVRNASGRGAIFGFCLPLVSPPEAGQTEVAQAQTRLRGQRLLVIDDDEFVRTGARLIAESAGMKVRELADSRGLFEEIRAFAPHALLCDRHLQDADGLELLAHVRSLHPGHQPRLILMTGDLPLPEVEPPLDGVLGKPFSVEQLAAILD